MHEVGQQVTWTYYPFGRRKPGERVPGTVVQVGKGRLRLEVPLLSGHGSVRRWIKLADIEEGGSNGTPA